MNTAESWYCERHHRRMIPRICAAVECSGCERRGPTPANGLTGRGAYYNEHDPKAAAWIRELIKAGVVAPGEVDERSIVDVRPDDLVGFTQCHFFAGIAVWSYALRLAGWPDDRPVWTGSCPCQPFSAAGRGKGFADERHLWPVFHRLIDERRPPVVFGEQVASKAGLSWFDAVRADLEGSGYAVGAADLCASGIGAPHIRQRLYFVAHAKINGPQMRGPLHGELHRERLDEICGTGLLAHTGGERRSEVGTQPRRCSEGSREEGVEQRPLHGVAVCGLADPEAALRRRAVDSGNGGGRAQKVGGSGSQCGASPTNGFWRNADWLFCRDGKWRPVKSGSQCLASRSPARVVRLRGYGNSIVAPLAAEFIQTCKEYLDARPE